MTNTVIKPRKFKKRSLEAKQRKYGYLFTLPFIIGGILFVVYPIIHSVIFSICDYKDYQYGNWGFHHFDEIWGASVDFRNKVLASLRDMALNVPVVVIFAFFMASVLNTKFRGRTFARSVMFLPVLISSGIIMGLSDNLAAQLLGSADRFSATAGDSFQVTTAFQIMLENMDLNPGLINFIVGAVGRINDIVRLSSVSIVIFIAGLQSISPSIYEAAYIEGATKWEVFWKISLPMVSPMILLSIVYTIIDAFNGQNNVVISTIHREVLKTEFNIASAMALSYSVIIVAIILFIFRALRKVIFYYD